MRRDLTEEECRSIALVLNFSIFDHNRCKKLHGAMKDEHALEDVLKTSLKYDVHTYKDLSLSDLEEIVRDYSSMDFSKCDSFLCVVLSHGNSKNEILTSDNRHFKISDFFKAFENNQSLLNKPKMFFIDSCRGPNKIKTLSETEKNNIFKSECVAKVDEKNVDCYGVKEADMYILHSTIEGYVSFIDRNTGSYFIQPVCKVLKSLGTDIHLLDIEQKVRVLLLEDKRLNSKQLCKSENTLTKKVFFGKALKIEYNLF